MSVWVGAPEEVIGFVAGRSISRSDAAIFRALYAPLRRFAGAVGPWEVDPDDLVQDALVKVLHGGSLDRFDNPGAYLRRTIINLSYNHMRRRETGTRANVRYVAGTSGAAEAEYPSDLADLMSLEPAERAVLYLHDAYGYSFGEISAAIDTPEGTCRQLASRARHRLRDTLTQEARS